MKELCKEILQRTVSMFFPSEYLIILLLLQQTTEMKTIDDLMKQTFISSKTIQTILNDFLRHSIISKKYFDSQIYYFIDYQKSIEMIVYRFQKIMISLTNQSFHSELEEQLVCINPFCGWKCSYAEGMFCFVNGEFHCQECGRIMKFQHSQTILENQKKCNERRRYLSSYKKLLKKLKKTYSSIKDYPQYHLPLKNDSIELNSYGMNNCQNDNTNKTIKNESKKQSETLFPWEYDENIKNKNETISNESSKNLSSNEKENEELFSEDFNEYLLSSECQFLENSKVFIDQKPQQIDSSNTTSSFPFVKIQFKKKYNNLNQLKENLI